MAAGTDGREVADEWRYCSVCRRNHDGGRKHIFTKQHKSRLSIILSKYTKKVRSARRLLAKPSVLEGELEPGAKMWCYCCDKEIDKHITDGYVSLEWGGLIEHMADPDHHKKARHYWWENGADTNQLQVVLLFPTEYRRYRDHVAEALKIMERERERKKIAKEAEMKQAVRLSVSSPVLEPCSHSSVDATSAPAQCNRLMPPSLQQPGSSVLSIVGGGGSNAPVSIPPLSTRFSRPAPGKVTIGAYGDNLTMIERTEPVDGHQGNIHSGATPPWLRDDEGTSSNTMSSMTFGPSLEEFTKHKERMRRAGLNPKRVGADFHLKLANQKQDSDDWLPSFGRVWNYGPRGHSKAEFLKESTKTATASSLPVRQSDSAGPSKVVMTVPTAVEDGASKSLLQAANDLTTTNNSIPKIKPYVRKRPRTAGSVETSIEPLESSPLNPSLVSSDATVADNSNELSTGGDIDGDVVKVKPYVRKRKMLSK